MRDHNKLPDLRIVRDDFNYNPRNGELSYNMPRKDVVFGQVVTSGTVRVPAGGSPFPVARVIWYWMTGEDPGNLIVDHIDGNHSNNKWNNLRLATHQQNQFNKKAYGQYAKGVVFKADANRSKPWSARIRIGGKKVALGSYSTHDEAAEAYQIAAELIQGEFRRKD